MRQVQEQVLAGTSYTETFADDYQIRLPREIKKPTDARFLPITHDSRANDRAIAKAVEIIYKFDEVTEEVIGKYRKHWKELKYFDVKELLNRFVSGHQSTEQLIRVYESVLADSDINPITYIHAKRHFTVAQIFLNKFEEIDVEKITREELKIDEGQEGNFRLGVFVGLEPILVTALFSAMHRDDAKLSQAYGRLVDRYSHMVAAMYPKEYLQATALNKPAYPAEAYSKFLEYIEVARHGQILL